MKAPSHLKEKVCSYAGVELNPRATLLRFYGLMLLGAALTLLICPQFGVGPLGGGHGIGHWVMPYGAAVCGAFCSAVFMGAGTLFALLFLSPCQWRWVWRHQFLLIIPPVACSFMALMGAKLIGDLNAMHSGAIFNLAWLIMGLVTAWLILRTMKVLRPI